MNSQKTMVKSPNRPLNTILHRLHDRDFSLLAPHLQEYEAASNQVLYNPGDNVETAYFPCGPSVVSFVVSIEEGHDVETTLIGREGAFGGIFGKGPLPAYSQIVVRYGGPFVHIPVRRLEAAKRKSESLKEEFDRYANCLLAQIVQSAACNAAHSSEQRAAKLIIAASDRIGDDAVPITHERLGAMLGIGRSYASRVVETFKAQGILKTKRGAMLVCDRGRLEKKACSCNKAVGAHFDEVLRHRRHK
jgi:hypothetical protein